MVFFALGAPFAGALEMIVYAGAIMVLFVFVVMMLNLGEQGAAQEKAWLKPRHLAGPGAAGRGVADGVAEPRCGGVTPSA